jgi:hypothetical protein
MVSSLSILRHGYRLLDAEVYGALVAVREPRALIVDDADADAEVAVPRAEPYLPAFDHDAGESFLLDERLALYAMLFCHIERTRGDPG